MCLVQLCRLFDVTEVNSFNFRTKDVSKSLKEYAFFVDKALAAVTAFAAQEFEKFDPHVGDSGCQIRAVKTLLLAKDARFVEALQEFAGRASRVQEACTRKLHEIGNASKIKPVQADLSEDLLLEVTADIAYIVQGYLYTQTHVNSPLTKENCFFPCPKVDPNRLTDPDTMSRRRCNDVVRIMRRNLSQVALDFLRLQAKLSGNPVYAIAVSDACVRVVDTIFQSVPMFYSYQILLQTCERENIPIVFKVKLYATDREQALIGTEYIPLNSTTGSTTACARSALVCMFEGLCQGDAAYLQASKVKRYKLLTQKGQEVIFAGAADHPQYAKGLKNTQDLFTIDNLAALEITVPEELRFKRCIERARVMGCCESNKSLFFIQHVYPQASRAFIEEQSNEGKTDDQCVD